jgi:ligand-binding SRPBCC domain-containing protein
MATITRSAEIIATRDTVRQYYANPDYATQWSHIITLWEPDEAWPSAGATARMGVKSAGIAGEGIATSLAYDDETLSHHFRFEPANRMPPFETWFTFDEQDGKTTVTQKLVYTIPGSFMGKALDKLFVERQNANDMQQQLLNLKAMVEGSA